MHGVSEFFTFKFEPQFKSIQSIFRVGVQITSKLIPKSNRHVEYEHAMK